MDNIEYQDLIGVPFVDNGRDENGLDCWGLVKEIYRRRGIKLREFTASSWDIEAVKRQVQEGSADWDRIDTPEIGCLILVATDNNNIGNHVGIVVDSRRFVHAYAGARGVCLSYIKRWQGQLIGYYRYRGGANNDTAM